MPQDPSRTSISAEAEALGRTVRKRQPADIACPGVIPHGKCEETYLVVKVSPSQQLLDNQAFSCTRDEVVKHITHRPSPRTTMIARVLARLGTYRTGIVQRKNQSEVASKFFVFFSCFPSVFQSTAIRHKKRSKRRTHVTVPVLRRPPLRQFPR